MIKAYAIKNKHTGKQWKTGKNKNVWTMPHHAKSAFRINEGIHFEDQDEYIIVELIETVTSEVE